jgi:long-chain acyl-CoA synthetase
MSNEISCGANPQMEAYLERFSSALELFRSSVHEHPEQVAVRYLDLALSYRDIDQLSDRFASSLVQSRVGDRDRVALLMQNLPHFVVAVYGIWKAGAIAVPMNPMNRQRELSLLFDDCKPAALVVEQSLHSEVVSTLPTTGYRPGNIFTVAPSDFVSTDKTVSESSAQADGTKRFVDAIRTAPSIGSSTCSLRQSDIAYLVYTSGTTGIPKGVMLTHRNALAGSAVAQSRFAMTRGMTMLCIAPLFHVTGLMMQMHSTLALGGTLILAYRFDPSRMVETIRREQPTHMMGAATAYIAISNVAGATAADMRSLRVVGSGGAPTAPAVARRLEQFFGVTLQTGYGMTETTAAVHGTPAGISAPIDPATGTLSIGPAIDGCHAWIADDDGKAVSVRQLGEIVINGPVVAAGYWERPDDTKSTFKSDGVRSGDIGFFDESGWFYVVDRKKDVIVASGYKIWPREVEDVLYSHPAVREAAVVGVPDAYRGETVRAVVSLAHEATVTTSQLIEHCRENLAAYKVPKELLIIADLPKTPAGKVLRRELRGSL